MTKRESINQSIWKLRPYKESGAGELKSLQLREDMYSMLFISFVKPQYKTYCDLVAKTGKPRPSDEKELDLDLEPHEKNSRENETKSWC